jgi:hypothetical protein
MARRDPGTIKILAEFFFLKLEAAIRAAREPPRFVPIAPSPIAVDERRDRVRSALGEEVRWSKKPLRHGHISLFDR